MTDIALLSLIPQVTKWLEEDDLQRNFHYTRALPQTPVKLSVKIKSPMVLAGTDYFAAVFVALGASADDFQELRALEGKELEQGHVIELKSALPFSLTVTAERLALNLLQHASSIATWTKSHVELAKKSNIRILDTRKTTPGLRSLEKYAVRVGGGFNHRLGQTDSWMIKDNHKTCLGGLEGALKFFLDQGVFYNSLIAEIHDLKELEKALSLGITHVMLDNFTPELIREAVKMKRPGMTFEVSGGLKLSTIPDYLVSGVDALSLGALTYSAPRVDISLKYKPV